MGSPFRHVRGGTPESILLEPDDQAYVTLLIPDPGVAGPGCVPVESQGIAVALAGTGDRKVYAERAAIVCAAEGTGSPRSASSSKPLRSSAGRRDVRRVDPCHQLPYPLFERRVMSGSRALVLGGGGVVGASWEAGLMDGLRAAGVAVDEADTVIGTSAGAWSAHV